MSEQLPQESYLNIFIRFLKFGFLAWGGPVPQIAMIKQELVLEKKWISTEKFNRALAVYQVLPGPEAHELCVYFGMIRRGRLGGFLAGLGFMLPGFVLMLLLTWFYFSYGIKSIIFTGIFYGFKPAVVALIVRATHRIGEHALHNRFLILLAILSFTANILKVYFFIPIVLAGVIYFLFSIQRKTAAYVLMGLSIGALVFYSYINGFEITSVGPATTIPVHDGVLKEVNNAELFLSGLNGGLLTFGGAYTAIPFLQQDAVETGQWMTNGQFLDGLALSSILPAPLIIFSTFVGYAGGGLSGALLMTIGIFLPAFLFTLIGHNFFERITENKKLVAFLDGVTAGVIGLIAGTASFLFLGIVGDIPSLIIFGIGLLLLYKWKSKASVPVLVILAGLIGLVIKLIA